MVKSGNENTVIVSNTDSTEPKIQDVVDYELVLNAIENCLPAEQLHEFRLSGK